MNGIDFNTSMEWFSTNAWWLVLSTVAILVGSYFSVVERVEKYIKRPKLTFESKTFSEILTNEKGEKYQKEVFWIYISNKGKDMAKNCTAKLKITDIDSTQDIIDKNIPYKLGIFPIYWSIGNQKIPTINIFPIENDTAMIKMPLNILSTPVTADKDSSGQITVEWEDPITRIDPIIPLKTNLLFPIHFDVKIFVNAENAKPLIGEFELMLLDIRSDRKNKITFTVKN